MNSRRPTLLLLLVIAAVMSFWFTRPAGAQLSKMGEGKDFKYPAEYYPVSNGVRRLKTLITGAKWQMMSNNIVALKEPRIERTREDGQLEWTVLARECQFSLLTKEARGSSNVFFRTADERMFLTGVGFFWQQTNSLLTLSNQTLTWIDKTALTNAPKP